MCNAVKNIFKVAVALVVAAAILIFGLDYVLSDVLYIPLIVFLDICVLIGVIKYISYLSEKQSEKYNPL